METLAGPRSFQRKLLEPGNSPMARIISIPEITFEVAFRRVVLVSHRIRLLPRSCRRDVLLWHKVLLFFVLRSGWARAVSAKKTTRRERTGSWRRRSINQYSGPTRGDKPRVGRIHQIR